LPYEKYKTAKTDLIGDIPDHWEEWKASHGFGQIGSGTTPKSDNSAYYGGETLWVTTSELRETYVFDTAIKVTDEALAGHSALKQYPIDSVVIAMYGATIGRLGMLGKSASVNQACCVYAQPEKFHPRFFYFWLWMRRPILISLSSGGGQPNLNQEELKRIRVPIPPLGEQEKIAAFLDWKTGQIDALIAKKQALIEKLKEKRLAAITQAVTKGLDPAMPMRDSGISWLGKVPASWRVKRLRYCAGTVTSGSRGWAEFFSESGALFLRITNLDRESISMKLDDLQRVKPPDGAEGARTLTKAGDLLISITADLGSVAVIPEDFESAYISQHLSLVRLDSDDIDPNWIAYSILSLAGKYQLNTAGYGGTKIQLSLSDIKDITFCHPATLDEQQSVLRVVQKEIKRNNKLIELAEEAIGRLTEYRTALITAATTGQIDVRNVAIPAQA
jgi:restriction endonuclease S subunit